METAGVDFKVNTLRLTRIEKSGELGEAVVVRGGKRPPR